MYFQQDVLDKYMILWTCLACSITPVNGEFRIQKGTINLNAKEGGKLSTTAYHLAHGEMKFTPIIKDGSEEFLLAHLSLKGHNMLMTAPWHTT